jgi:hypothetical protein
VAVLWLGLAMASPLRAEARDQSLPPPGTTRLIRIGPQALVSEDEHGNVTMVDEPAPKAQRGKALVLFLGILTGAVVEDVFYGPSDLVRGAVIGKTVGSALP